MIARDGFMQLVPQPFYVINPRAVNWLEHQAELGVLLQPSLGLFAFVNLITHDPQPASRADMASEGLPRLHAPIQPTCS